MKTSAVSTRPKEGRLTLRPLEINRERPLVAVQRKEGDVDLVSARPAGCDMSLPFAGDRLHFDDIRAEVAEALGGEGAGHGDGAVEDPVAGKNAHLGLLSLVRWPARIIDEHDCQGVIAACYCGLIPGTNHI